MYVLFDADMKGLIAVCFLFGVLSSSLLPYQVSSQDINPVTCSPNKMTFALKASSVSSFKASELSLTDSSCIAENLNSVYYFTTYLDQCGTSIQVTDTKIIYSNYVKSRPPKVGAIIDDVRKVEIKFSCEYPRKEKLIAHIRPANIQPMMKAYLSRGKFLFSMDLFATDQFKDELSLPASFNLKQPIYIQVKVKSVRDQLSIVAQNCYATPTADGDNPKYDLIKNRCPNKDDGRVTSLDSPSINLQRFSVSAFYFLDAGQDQFVYFHCHVIACDGSDRSSVCAEGCPNKKRSLFHKHSHKGLMTFKMTQGPIFVRKELNGASKSSKLNKMIIH